MRVELGARRGVDFDDLVALKCAHELAQGGMHALAQSIADAVETILDVPVRERIPGGRASVGSGVAVEGLPPRPDAGFFGRDPASRPRP